VVLRRSNIADLEALTRVVRQVLLAIRVRADSRTEHLLPHGTAPNEHDTNATWLPYTLRWPFLCLVITLTIVLLLIVILLYRLSATNHGLGNNDGSSILLFGWRFTPTLIAVLYVQLTAMLLDDVKRTEPFARLATAGGSKASSAILQAPGAWWNALSDGFSRKKNGGRRSWLLICSALVNILGFLAMSPLSSSLLSSQDVSVPKRVDFERMTPKADSALAMNAGRETYFRTIGHLLQNVSTSAWISDNYTILPFWPSDGGHAPLGPLLSTTPQTWQAETVVLNSELECEPMKLVSTGNLNDTFTSANTGAVHNATTVSIVLRSDDGCTYGLELEDGLGMVLQGGGTWSNLMTFSIPTWNSGEGAVAGNLGLNSTSGMARLNHSKECGDREILLISTAWIENPGGGLDPTNLDFLSNFTYSARICSTNFYMANMTVTASLSGAASEVSFDEQEYNQTRVAIPGTFLNVNELQTLSLDPGWIYYMSLPEGTTRPSLGGPSIILGSFYNFNLTTMINDVDVGSKAARMKQRFFGEVLQSSLTQEGASQNDNIQGKIIVVERRVIVTGGVAIALAALLFSSFCLLVLIWWWSSLRRRPLNLRSDPATTTLIASLVTLEPRTRLAIRNLDQSSKRQMQESLLEKHFYTLPNALHELEPKEGDGTGKLPHLKASSIH
jgi:hypothetical protein